MANRIGMSVAAFRRDAASALAKAADNRAKDGNKICG
jgi:hypothetical protein